MINYNGQLRNLIVGTKKTIAMCTYYEVPGREQLVLHFGDVPEEEWRDKMSPLVAAD